MTQTVETVETRATAPRIPPHCASKVANATLTSSTTSLASVFPSPAYNKVVFANVNLIYSTGRGTMSANPTR